MTKKELMDRLSKEGRSVLDDDNVYNQYLEYSKDSKFKKIADNLSTQGRAYLDDDNVYAEYNSLSEQPKVITKESRMGIALGNQGKGDTPYFYSVTNAVDGSEIEGIPSSTKLDPEKVKAELQKQYPNIQLQVDERVTEDPKVWQQYAKDNVLGGDYLAQVAPRLSRAYGNDAGMLNTGLAVLGDMSSGFGRSVNALAGNDLGDYTGQYGSDNMAAKIASGVITDPMLLPSLAIGGPTAYLGRNMRRVGVASEMIPKNVAPITSAVTSKLRNAPVAGFAFGVTDAAGNMLLNDVAVGNTPTLQEAAIRGGVGAVGGALIPLGFEYLPKANLNVGKYNPIDFENPGMNAINRGYITPEELSVSYSQGKKVGDGIAGYNDITPLQTNDSAKSPIANILGSVEQKITDPLQGAIKYYQENIGKPINEKLLQPLGTLSDVSVGNVVRSSGKYSQKDAVILDNIAKELYDKFSQNTDATKADTALIIKQMKKDYPEDKYQKVIDSYVSQLKPLGKFK